MKKKALKIVNILLIVAIILLVLSVTRSIIVTGKTKATYTDIQEKYQTTIPSNEKDNSNQKFKEMKAINPDYKFWLNIENTNINYPVVQASDNEYYLKHNFNKSAIASGSIFLDYQNDPSNDFNEIIFGHNMKNGTMFSNLIKFKDKDFFNQNNKISIEDENYKYVYEVFSAYTESAYNNFDYLYNINQKDLSETDKLKYLEYLKSKSIYQNTIPLSNTDKIITLATCSYEFEEARTIVHAKLIDKIKLT